MKWNQDGVIAGSVFLASLVLGAVLLMGIGTIKAPTTLREITLDFARVDNIKPNLTQVKMAGLPIGKVTEVRILSLDERKQIFEKDGTRKNIRVTAEVDTDVYLSDQVTASIRQASLMSEHFVELEPGDLAAAPMPDGFVIQGSAPSGMGDLMGGSGELLGNLKSASGSIKDLTATLNVKLPGVMGRLESVLGNANLLVGDISSADNRDSIKKSIANIRVVTENLKVVSTHAKLLTATLAQRPWRVIFGGKPNELPDENEVIKSLKAYPVKPAEAPESEEQPKPAPTTTATKKAKAGAR